MTDPTDDLLRDARRPPAPVDGRKRTQRIATGVSSARTRVEASSVGHVRRRLVEADIANQALILAALALTLFLPVVVTLAAVLPLGGDNDLPATIGARLGLSHAAIVDIQKLFPNDSTVRGESTVVASLFTVLSAYAWPAVLQRGYELAWAVPTRGWRGLWRPLVWLMVFVAFGAALLALPSSPVIPQPWRTVVLLAAGTPLMFGWAWWTQHFLLRGEVGWRRLLAGAVAMTVGLVLLRTAASLILSRSIEYNYDRYGPLGIVFLLVSWLVGLSFIVLGGPVLGAALHERRAQAAAAPAPGPDDGTGERDSGTGADGDRAKDHPGAAPTVAGTAAPTG